MNENGQPFPYFAYGFNLNLAQMRQRCPRLQVLGIARLPDYRIGFYGYSREWDGAVETIIPDPGSEVWGVLYQLDVFDWQRLDEFQNVRADGRGTYFHFPLEVEDSGRLVRVAFTYKKDSLGKPERPGSEYMNIIIQGAREQGLPKNYVTELGRIHTKPALYSLPRKKPVNKMSRENCSGCAGDQGAPSPEKLN